MKLWIDDSRPTPDGYTWCKSVKGAKKLILELEKEQERLYRIACRNFQSGYKDGYYTLLSMCNRRDIDIIDIDPDISGYNEFLDWLEKDGHNYAVRVHTD